MDWKPRGKDPAVEVVGLLGATAEGGNHEGGAATPWGSGEVETGEEGGASSLAGAFLNDHMPARRDCRVCVHIPWRLTSQASSRGG